MTPRNDSIVVTLHEVHSRTFTVHVDALCADMGWPRDFDEGDLADLIEHTDAWGRDDAPRFAWLVEQLPSDAWREVFEIKRAAALPGTQS